ncbi:MAG: efflux RND transporter permease subunit [Halofilum sp. (in: g-proteobacteria)]|nr:efflux RND transporter permease subunit [Halofilum sp. (in: g-proteobacteria)]
MLVHLLHRPGLVLLGAAVVLVGVYVAYYHLGRGVEFFPDIEPDYTQVQVRARGDLSIRERDRAASQRRVSAIDGIAQFATRRTPRCDTRIGARLPADTIGRAAARVSTGRRRGRRPTTSRRVRGAPRALPASTSQVASRSMGRRRGKPIELAAVAAHRRPDLAPAVEQRAATSWTRIGGFVDVEDTRPLPGIEWRLVVDREAAARYGADVLLLGQAVRMLTSGVDLGGYRPDDADEEVDIRIRFPYDERSLDQLDALRVPTRAGQIPVTNFVRFEPAPKTGTIRRADGRRVMTVKADVAPGMLPDEQVQRLRAALPGADLPAGVGVTFKGEDEEMRAARAFLGKAFIAAVFLDG